MNFRVIIAVECISCMYDPVYKLVFARGSAPDCGIAPYAKSEMYTGLSVSGCWRLVLRCW